MRYATDLISAREERALIENLRGLPFKEFEFHGFLGKRRTVSFGWHYDFNGGGLKQAGGLPAASSNARTRGRRCYCLRAGARSDHRIQAWGRDRMASGSSTIRGRHRNFSSRPLQL